VAQHFSISIPPIALWEGVDVREDDPRLLVGAVGWLHARTVQEVAAGDHTVFIGEVLSIEQGPGRGALVYLHRDYHAL
jgi:flavin reductase (DIM6/NTAB) family NADH-FMN oxidoreductase RutF